MDEGPSFVEEEGYFFTGDPSSMVPRLETHTEDRTDVTVLLHTHSLRPLLSTGLT